MKRFDWYDEIHRLDAEADARRITFILGAHEFPWDMSQALGLALYRTYAVPSIGGLLGDTEEFTDRTQHRYDDTALLLGQMLQHGFEPGRGRDALRRMNQMHRSYDISNDDYLYVLSTFVVMPPRWLNDWGFGWRRLSEHEIRANTNYYRDLGRHMGIKEIPGTYEEFCTLMDGYEREHFGYTEGGRAVSDSTLELMLTFSPPWQRPLMKKFTTALLDDRLTEAFRYEPATPFWKGAARFALKARAKVVRFMPPRVEPRTEEDNPNIKSYPEGFDPNRIGTFPTKCPVPHDLKTVEVSGSRDRVPAPGEALPPEQRASARQGAQQGERG
ncbi:oxygenase MpaB family protein [Nocardiopsis halophila]|uniref:oxygenase MpaB family protein n=1 Tax=Nocardiopsis halophila TaxID=141692 RepID=UPI000345D784|nr:oxygenase MpaB family protein [Nocardiopsis halophila]